MAQDGEDFGYLSYPVPDLKKELFSIEDMEEADREALADLLTNAATLPELRDPLLKAKCLAIALRFDRVHKGAFMANFALKGGDRPNPYGTLTDLEEIASRLTHNAHELGASESEGVNSAALYVFEIASDLVPERSDLAYASKVYRESSGLGPPEWDALFPNGLPGMGVGDTSAVAKEDMEEEALPTLPMPSLEESEAPTLPRMQTLIKGLLVRDLGGNRFAGKASQMNATARYVGGDRELFVKFNQPVGDMMESALAEVIKFLRVRHERLPEGFEVEISFEEQYIAKDGPSAAVACALLLEGLIEDIDWEKKFAVTGDMNADGSVQSVGGIDGKIRGATNRDCEIIAIPVQNERLIADLQMVDGSAALRDIQIFSIETFDEAVALARAHEERDEDLQTAIDTFAEVQAVLQRPSGLRFLTNGHVVVRLQKVLQLAPNHLSAKYLLLRAQGREPRNLTMGGSLLSLDRAAAPLISALRAGQFEPRSSGLDVDKYGLAVSQLSRVRGRLDPKVKPVADAILSYAKLMRGYVNNPPKSRNNIDALISQIRSAGMSVVSAYDSLENSIEYQETFMQ